jgi:peptide deformylase
MIYTMREWDDPILREPSVWVEESFSKDRLQEIIANMKETMYTIGAVGLAANQCGIPLRIMLVGRGAKFEESLVCINPAVTLRTHETAIHTEGCFSLPGVCGLVERPRYINLTYKNLEGSLVVMPLDDYNYASVIAQHELDHLDGIFFTDYATEIWEETDSVTLTYKAKLNATS